jgi:hypothetical protein
VTVTFPVTVAMTLPVTLHVNVAVAVAVAVVVTARTSVSRTPPISTAFKSPPFHSYHGVQATLTIFAVYSVRGVKAVTTISVVGRRTIHANPNFQKQNSGVTRSAGWKSNASTERVFFHDIVLLTTETMNRIPPPSLFYSRNCKHCIALLREYHTLATNAGIQIVCVDNRLDKIPQIVTEVPALIIPAEKRIVFSKDMRTKLNSIIETANKPKEVNPVEAQGNTAKVFNFLHGPHTDQIAIVANRVDDNYANPFYSNQNFNTLAEPEDTTPSEKISPSSISSFAAQWDADMAEIARTQPRPSKYNVI